ncbi:hypothetical protein [Trichormus sp. NMC-1]|uniref:hypothetical protein n=2 Tax=Trichormus sp. NMC-1 TaxID=1853259 RepID=UPI0008DBFB5B|nr:hypothetical protein [Trichormus sp. NMC-1]
MQQILQNTKRLVSVSLATLLILVSTITIFPSTASADNNVVKIECTSDCGNIVPFAAGVVSGSAVTLMATGDTATLATLAATGAATIGEITTALAGLGVAAGTAVSSPVLVPVAVAAAGGYGAYQLWHHFSDNQSQNAN